MKHASVHSSRVVLLLALALAAACTTGTDVTDPAPASEEQARLDRIALIAHRLVADAKAQPQKPASALVDDLVKLAQEADGP